MQSDKKQVIALLIIGSIILLILLKFLPNNLPNPVTDDSLISSDANSSQTGRFSRPCTEPPAYVFLKKHKTASTTFRQLMSHFSKHKGLTGEPQMIGPQGGCYPARFEKGCWPADGHVDPLQNLNYHFRWNADYLPTIIQPGSAVITTIRDPLATFRSVYNYFYLGRAEGKNSKCDMPCWKEPFVTFLGGREKVPIEEFLDLLPQVFNNSHTRNFRAKNYQAFEMGLDHLNDDEEYIINELQRLDTQFDLGKLI